MKISKYDIVQADLSGTIGSEQKGIRPVLIVQNNIGNVYSGTTIVIPFTSDLNKRNIPTHTLIKRNKINGLKVDSLLLGEQIRVISNKRIIKYIGKIVNEKEKEEIKRVYLANFGQ